MMIGQNLSIPSRRGILGGGLALGASSLAPWARADERAAALDAALKQVFEAQSPVALAGAVWRDGACLWRGATGVRQAGGDDPVTVSDLWHLGSNTKAVTSALWERLADQGRVVRDRALAEVARTAFPDLTLHSGWEGCTVEDFLRHRAGLHDSSRITPTWLMAARISKDTPVEQRSALARQALAGPPDGPRGTFQYGNANYIVAGAVMEALTGQSWEDLVRAEVFAPLGITTGGFGAPSGAQPRGHSGGRPVDPAFAGSDNPVSLGPAGTIHMGLEDYGRFLDASMQPGWLSQQAMTRLHTPLEGEDYALGWGVVGTRRWAGAPMLSHSGSNTMWFATAVLAPSRRMALVAVANDAAGGARACPSLIGEMLKQVADS